MTPASEPPDDDLAPLDPTEQTAAAPKLSADEHARKLALAREQILAAMRERHTLQPPLAWALLLGGVMGLLVLGVAVSVVLWLVASFVMDDPPAVRVWLVLYLLAIVPIVIWTERRMRDGFFTLAASDVDLTRDDDSSEYLFQRGAAHAMSLKNALLFGPRAIAGGYQALRGVRQRGLEMILPEAADTLTLMLSIDGGVKIKDLAPPDSDPMQLMPVLTWLDTHDYIGISSRGDRVWVSSPAKKRFIEQGIVVPKMEST